jgi:hypothetical protein
MNFLVVRIDGVTQDNDKNEVAFYKATCKLISNLCEIKVGKYSSIRCLFTHSYIILFPILKSEKTLSQSLLVYLPTWMSPLPRISFT